MFETKELLLEAIYKCVPYPKQITELDFSQKDQIRFTWRSSRFKVNLNGNVEEVSDGLLIGSDLSILMRGIIEIYHANLF